MKKILVAIFVSALFILNTKAQISYHIYGTIDRTDVDKLYLFNGKTIFDSTKITAGAFDMKGVYKSPTVAMLLTKTPHHSSKIILDNGDYKVNIDAKMNMNIVTTSVNYNLWMNSFGSVEIIYNYNAIKLLLADYELQIEKGNYNQQAEYLTKYKNIQLQLLNHYKKLVTDHPDSYIIPYLLKSKEILNKENFGSTFELLSPEVQKNEWGQELKTLLEKKTVSKLDVNQFEITMLGSQAQIFDTKLADGKIFDPSSLQGKWVLLDFWASWCAPCRAELPFLKDAQNQFLNKNFIIASVSVDKDVAAWQKALQEDNTPLFNHTNIADFGNSEGFKYYQVNSIPSNFLINPEGRIVALNLRGEDLVKTLNRLIK